MAKPKRTVTKPRRSQRLAVAPQSPDTARDIRARTIIVNKQQIGSKQNHVKNALLKQIASLIPIQKELDAMTPPNQEKQAKRSHAKVVEPQFTYNFTNPKGKPAPPSSSPKMTKI